MAKLLYFVLLAAVVWEAYADQDDEDQDFIPDADQNNREIKCGKYYAQYPNPKDCGSYIVCQHGQKTIKSCPSGQHYNFKTIRCVDRCDAYCNKTLSCECKWPTCGLDDVCFLEQIVGGCGNRVPRYFFDKRTGQCERFGYSGCMGNENNFKTLEECQQKCNKAKPIPGFRCLTMNGNFPNPDNCRTYFQCSGGKPQLMSCEAGLHYSDKSKTCEKPCDAYCDKSLSCECKWPTCGLDDLCFLPPEVGPCRAGFYNYYFNRRTGQCEKFLYGGCKGNKNNFQKKEECEKACTKPKPIPKFDCLMKNGHFPNPVNCGTYFQCSDFKPQLMSCEAGLHFSDKSKSCEKPCDAFCDKSQSCECKWPTCGLKDLCFLPPEIGPCRAAFRNYYFNRRTGQCEKFIYGGCEGNENNFRKQEDCEKACTKTKPMPKLVCLTKNGLFPNPDNCGAYFQCSDFEPQLTTCEAGLHFSDKTKSCEKPCDAFCDKSQACECKWPTCGLKDLCFLPPEVGPCRAAFRNYYFNRRTGQCEKFIYGGCGGNENNFRKKEDCEKSCTKSEEPPVDESLEPTSEESTEPTLEESTEPTSEESTEQPIDEFPDPPAEEVLDPSFECGSDGLYPHPKNCRSFVNCSKGVPTLNACPVKLHFNNKTKRCETPCKANCDRTYACKCKWPTCGTNALCFLPAKPGPCKGKFKRFYFNKRSGECATLEYGGCLGNENNFLTKHACERKCKHSLDICKLPYKTGPCKGKFERYYFNYKEEKCQKFTYGGCNKNHNNFKTLEECETTCLQNKHNPPSAPSFCNLPAEKGPCKGNIPRWYYIHGQNRCGMFSWGGCKGNGNNFQLQRDCETTCKSRFQDSSSEPICTEDGVRLDFESCGRYIQCSNGQRQIVSCPPGLHFNEASKQCDSPCDARCDMSLAWECGWPMGSDFECPRPDGKFQYPGNDRMYITCTNNIPTVQQCGGYQLFDIIKKECFYH